MSDNKVVIAGGGIGGLTLALTMHQIGVPFVVLESAREMRPVGVGINVQPNAVRELFDLGIDAKALDTIGLPAKEWALVGLNGKEVYAESRGTAAGYLWPQYAAHRGKLHMLLYQTLIDRAGKESVVLGAKVKGYSQPASGGVVVSVSNSDGSSSDDSSSDVSSSELFGSVLIGADGIILLCGHKCTQISHQYIGAGLSCGEAPFGQNHYEQNHHLSASVPTNIEWSSIRYPKLTLTEQL